MTEGCDADGWRYAFNWPREFSLASNWYDCDNKPVRSFVRRRRWARVRRRRVANPTVGVKVLEARGLPCPPENRGVSFIEQPRPVVQLSLGSEQRTLAPPPPDTAAVSGLLAVLRWNAEEGAVSFEVIDEHVRDGEVLSVDLYHAAAASSGGEDEATIRHSDPLLCSVKLPVEAIGELADGSEEGIWFACEVGGGGFVTKKLSEDAVATVLSQDDTGSETADSGGGSGGLGALAPHGCVKLRLETRLG